MPKIYNSIYPIHKVSLIFTFSIILFILFFIYFATGDAWFGWELIFFFVFFSYPLAILLRFTQNEAIFFSVIMLLHVVCALLAFYVYPSFFIHDFARDTEGFIRLANLHQTSFSIGVGVYVNFLDALFYFSPSPFSAYMISLIAVAITLFLLKAIANQFGIRKKLMVIMLFATCFPNDVIHTSVAMREAWEVLFIVVSAWSTIQFHNTKRMRFLIILFLSLICLGSLHEGLFYVAILWPFVFWAVLKIFRLLNRIDVVLKIILTGLIVFGLGLLLVYLAYIHASFFDSVFEYSNRVHIGGSTYRTFLSKDNSVLLNLLHVPLSVLYYWFYPFPWEIHRAKDIYGCFLGFTRLFFIVYSFYFILKSPELRQRHLGWALMMILLLISIFFAIGTANYGTSMRHNILTFWGFVILGTSGLYLHRRPYYKKHVNR